MGKEKGKGEGNKEIIMARDERADSASELQIRLKEV